MTNEVQSGATQWRHDCDCLPAVADARDSQPWERMHSQVSLANASYFIEEDRLDRDDLDEDDLQELVHEAEGTIIVCNVCGEIKEVDAA